MKFPVEISLGSLTLPLHGVLESLGIFIGFRYFLFLRKRQGDPIDQEKRLLVLVGAIFGAVAGSRLIGSLENPPGWFSSTHPLLYFYNNKTVLGGFLGGLAGVELIKRWAGEKRSSGDLFVYPIILALIIGRIGCFSMGVFEETYGTPTRSFSGMDLGDGQLRHPVSLYEITFLLALWISLKILVRNVRLSNGSLFKLFMIAYLLFRFFLDFIKPHFTYSIGFSTIQLTALAGLIYYSPFILNPKKLTEQDA